MIDESYKELLDKVEEDLKCGNAKIFWRPGTDIESDENLSRTDSAPDV